MTTPAVLLLVVECIFFAFVCTYLVMRGYQNRYILRKSYRVKSMRLAYGYSIVWSTIVLGLGICLEASLAIWALELQSFDTLTDLANILTILAALPAIIAVGFSAYVGHLRKEIIRMNNGLRPRAPVRLTRKTGF